MDVTIEIKIEQLREAARMIWIAKDGRQSYRAALQKNIEAQQKAIDGKPLSAADQKRVDD